LCNDTTLTLPQANAVGHTAWEELHARAEVEGGAVCLLMYEREDVIAAHTPPEELRARALVAHPERAGVVEAGRAPATGTSGQAPPPASTQGPPGGRGCDGWGWGWGPGGCPARGPQGGRH
jgi:hypothetical protein